MLDTKVNPKTHFTLRCRSHTRRAARGLQKARSRLSGPGHRGHRGHRGLRGLGSLQGLAGWSESQKKIFKVP